MEKNKISFVILFALLILNMTSCALADSGDSYPLEISDISPDTLAPGEKTALTFEIGNLGDEKITDIMFSWEEETGTILPVDSSNTKTLEEIDDDDEEELDFSVSVDANADPGLYKLDLTVTFLVEGETEYRTLESIAGIIVGGTTDFEIIVSDFSDGEILLSIMNIGQNDANSVRVSIPEQPGFTTGTTTSSIAGDIVKGDYTIVSFELSSSGGSELEVEIIYTDTTGVEQTVTKEVGLESSSSAVIPGDSDSENFDMTAMASMGGGFPGQTQDNSSSLKLILFGSAGLLLIVLIVVGVSLKKKKARKKKENENS